MPQLTRNFYFARLFYYLKCTSTVPSRWIPEGQSTRMMLNPPGELRRSAIKRRLTQQARTPQDFTTPWEFPSVATPLERLEELTLSPKQRIHDILYSVEVGRLQLSQIELIVTELSDLFISIQNGRIVSADPIIPYLRLLIQRMVDEVDYWYVRPSSFSLSTEPSKSHLVVALSKAWFFAIMSISHLPKVPVIAKKSSENNEVASPEQPFVLACQLLVNMLQLYHQHPSIYPEPNNTLYNNVLYSCYLCSSASDEAMHTAKAIIENVERSTPQDEVEKGRFLLPKPPDSVTLTHGMYNHMILIHAERAATVYGAAAQAEDWLMRMAKHNVQPTKGTFNRVLKAWAESPEKEGGNRAADILHLMCQLSDQAETLVLANEIAPDAISFGTVILAFMKRQQPEACQLILEEALAYQTKYISTRLGIDDLTECWTTTMFGWSKSDREDAPGRIEALLKDGIWIDGRQYTVKPTSAMFGACIEAHLRSNRLKGIERAEQYLRRMVEIMRQQRDAQLEAANSEAPKFPTLPKPTLGGPVSMSLTATEFNTVINAWYRSHNKFEADDLLGYKRQPTGYTSTNATNVLQLMLQLEEEGFTQCMPTYSSFFMCIDSWCKTAKRFVKPGKSPESSDIETIKAKKKDAVNAMKKAVSILDVAEARKISGDSSYAAVIQTLCNLQDPVCTYEAARILQRYEEKTDAWNLNWQEETAWMYVEITKNLSLLGSTEAAELALHILRRIPASGKRSVTKNKNWIYKNVLSAFSRCPGPRAGIVASELFVELSSTISSDPKLNNSLNVDLCERILWILVYSRNKQAAYDSCDILYAIMTLYFDGKSSFEPSSRCFDSCLHALSDCIDERQMSLAVELVKLIVEKYECKVFSHLPSREAIDKVITSCKRVGSEEMVRNAKEITLFSEKHSNVIKSSKKSNV